MGCSVLASFRTANMAEELKNTAAKAIITPIRSSEWALANKKPGLVTRATPARLTRMHPQAGNGNFSLSTMEAIMATTTGWKKIITVASANGRWM